MQHYSNNSENDQTLIDIETIIDNRCREFESMVRQWIDTPLFASFSGTSYSVVMQHPKGSLVAHISTNDKLSNVVFYSIPFSEMEYMYGVN